MSITSIFLWSLAAAAIIFDIYIIMKKGKSESISAYIIRGSKKYPLIVFLAGIVAGHLLWNMQTSDIYPDVECKEITK